MSNANQDIRKAVKEADVKLWQVADRYGITDVTFSKKLRKELPTKEKTVIFQIINELRSEVMV